MHEIVVYMQTLAHTGGKQLKVFLCLHCSCVLKTNMSWDKPTCVTLRGKKTKLNNVLMLCIMWKEGADIQQSSSLLVWLKSSHCLNKVHSRTPLNKWDLMNLMRPRVSDVSYPEAMRHIVRKRTATNQNNAHILIGSAGSCSIFLFLVHILRNSSVHRKGLFSLLSFSSVFCLHCPTFPLLSCLAYHMMSVNMFLSL